MLLGRLSLVAAPNQGNNMTREADLKQLRREYKETRDLNLKKAIRKAGGKIRRETRVIKSMRESLIKEHREGRMDNVKDIHEYIKNKEKYQNG